MNVAAIVMLIGLGFAATAAAQAGPSEKPSGPAPSSKAQLSEIRSLVHELQARSEKLRELMAQYRSLVEQRPQPEGGGPEAKQAHEAQLARWNTALERLLRRVDGARAEVVETTARLDQLAGGPLPTALAKDVASARNEAEAQRAAAEQVLAKAKRSPAPKHAKKPAAEKPAPPIPDDL